MRVLFFGTPDFAVPCLRVLCEHADLKPIAVVTQPDRPAGRGEKLTQSPVKRFALEAGLEVLQPVSLRRNEEFMARASALGPFDVGVVVAFGQILPTAVLQLPRRGCINVHASLLPRWRGAAPMQRAILAGDAETGVSLMQMEAGLDTGPVYCHRPVVLGEQKDLGALHDELAAAGAALLCEMLPAIVAGERTAVAQDESLVTYAKKIENEEARIDWARPAVEIARQLRAFSPVPGAYTFIGEKRLKVWRGSAKSEVEAFHAAVPGEVVLADQRIEVRCGQGAVALEEVQLEGRRRMAAAEFLRGGALTPGMRLR